MIEVCITRHHRDDLLDKVRVPKEQNRSYEALGVLTSKFAQYHFLLILWVKASCKTYPESREVK